MDVKRPIQGSGVNLGVLIESFPYKMALGNNQSVHFTAYLLIHLLKACLTSKQTIPSSSGVKFEGRPKLPHRSSGITPGWGNSEHVQGFSLAPTSPEPMMRFGFHVYHFKGEGSYSTLL